MLAVDAQGNAIDGDQILAVLALAKHVDIVAVTVMTNLGFHRLMEEHGIRVVTTDVGDRYVLEALRRGETSAASSPATSSGSTATSPATASSRRCSSARPSTGARSRRPSRSSS